MRKNKTALASALEVYDYCAEPENIELHLNRPVVSFGRLAKEIADPEPGLALLKQYGIVGERFAQPDFRKRVVIPLVPQWFGSGSRVRVLELLTPKPPVPQRTYAPVVCLHTSYASVNGLFRQFKAGTTITDEVTARALVLGNAPVAPAGSTELYCPKCRHRFHESEQPAGGTVLIVLRDLHYVPVNGAILQFKEGDLVSAQNIVAYLQKNFANYVSTVERQRYQLCPACQHFAPRPAHYAAVPVPA